MTPIEINYQLLTKLSRLTFSSEDARDAKVLLCNPDFDKGLFVATCFKQKVAGLVYLNLTRWGIWRLIPWVGFALKFFYLGNQERNRRLQKELKRIIGCAADNGLDIRPLKGSVLVPLIYNDGGSRLLLDVDFFARRTDITKASSVFNKLGYIQGKFDKKRNCIVPLPREQKLLWQLKMFETPPFIKVMDDEYVDYGNYFTLDLSFGISFGEKDQVSELILNNGATLGGFYTLSEVDFFIQLCGHLYKEASNESWADIDLDINLIKFCDVREFALKMLSDKIFPQMRDRVLELNSEKAVHYALHSVYEIYRDAFIAEMIEAFSFTFKDDVFMKAIYRQGGSLVSLRECSLIQSIGNL